jgi:hypothetical protein
MNGFVRRVRPFVTMAEPVSTHEVAHTVVHGRGHGHTDRRLGLIEVCEAILLALVAIATAWSGYQTGKWDGHQASLYSLSSKYRVQANTAITLSGQQRLYDTNTFGFWLQSKAQGNEEDAELFERRFRPEYRSAFRAWLALDPFNNPKAPPGPIFMPQYKNAAAEVAAAKEQQAGHAFDEGTKAREKADKYLRNTVLLAMVLFLTALAQKFKFQSVRVGLLVLCAVLLVVALFYLVKYPRA